MSRGPGLGPGFARLWGANLSSNLADGLGMTAIPLLAATLTRDPLLISLVGVASFLPWLLFGVLAGSVVDRVDRRRLAALANGARAVVAAALCVLVATDSVAIAVLIGAAFVFGLFETAADGCVQAMVPAIVPGTGLVRANARIQGTEVVAQTFVAAPAASALFAVTMALPFALHSAAFAVAAVLVLTLPAIAARARPVPGEIAGGHGVADGIRFLVGDRLLRSLWAVNICVGFFNALAHATVVLYVLDVLGLPAAAYGVFVMTAAVGAVLGALTTARVVARLGRGRTMVVSVSVCGLAYVLCGAGGHVVPAAVGYVLVGWSVSAWNIVSMALRQELVPGRLLGRVHGAWRSLGWGVIPVGTFAGGLIGRVDLRLPLVAGGIGIALAGLLFHRVLLAVPAAMEPSVAESSQNAVAP